MGFVQQLSTNSASQAITAQGGNTLIVGILAARTSGAPGAPGDTLNTYTQRQFITAAGQQIALYDSIGIAGSGPQSLTVAFTPGGISAGNALFIIEASGITAYDTGSTGTGTTGDPATSALTLAQANEFVVGFAGAATAGVSQTLGAGSGFTVDATHGNQTWGNGGTFSAAMEYGIFSSNPTPAFATSITALWQMLSVAYKMTASAGLPPQLMRRGMS